MTLEYLGDQIVYGVNHPKAYMIWETELENVKCATKLAGGKPYLLFDIRKAKGISSDARRKLSSHDGMAAVALIIGSGFSRIIGNFMIGLNKTKSPIKLFKTKEDGLAWLKSLQ